MNTLHGKGRELLIDVISLLHSRCSTEKFAEKWGDDNTCFFLEHFLIPLVKATNKETHALILEKLALFLAVFNDSISTPTEMEVVIGLN